MIRMVQVAIVLAVRRMIGEEETAAVDVDKRKKNEEKIEGKDDDGGAIVLLVKKNRIIMNDVKGNAVIDGIDQSRLMIVKLTMIRNNLSFFCQWMVRDVNFNQYEVFP